MCLDCDKKRCGKCKRLRGYTEFPRSIWEMVDDCPEFGCNTCTRGNRTIGMWTCQKKRCKKQKPIAAFSRAMKLHDGKVLGKYRVCDECLNRHDEELAAMNKESWQQVQTKKQRQL